MSIKTKLLIPTMAAILLVGALTLASAVLLFSRFVEKSTRDRVEAGSKVAVRNLEFLKADANVAALAISQNPGIVDALASGNRDLLLTRAKLLQRETGAEFCTILDAEGSVILRTHAPERSGDSLLSQVNVRSALDGKIRAVLERGTVVLLAVRSGAPIRDDGGTLIGAVSVGYRLDSPQFVDSIQQMLQCEAGIILGDTRLSTTVRREDGARAVGTKADPHVSETVLAGAPYEGRADILGRAALTRYTPIPGPDNKALGMLFVGRYVDEAEQTIRAFVRNGALMTLGLLIAAIAIVHVVVNRIAGPVRRMTAAAAALASGDTDIDLREVTAKGEIGTLADAFNAMIRNARQQVGTMETIAEGGLATPLMERSEKDVVNRALEKLNQTVWAKTAEIRERNELLQKTNATLDSAREAAERASRAKTDFLSNISHELRTPLNAVIGLSQLTLDGGGLPEGAAPNLERIYGAGSTLLGIVNDILDLSKIEAGKFSVVEGEYDVSGMINDVVSQNVLLIGSKPVRFEMRIDENLPARLLGDELRIKQILNNILSNAFKYTERGLVSFELRCARESARHFRLTARIGDTGCGIRPGDIDSLFVDYMRFDPAVNRKVNGTGLGLSIAKRLAEMMDGGIAVESAYGQGSVFTADFRQERVNDDVIGAETAENLSRFRYSENKRRAGGMRERVQFPRARVLVVDDNATNLDVARGLMKPYGMRIDCVESGAAAVEAIRAGEPRYNAVFMDHMMPEMDGVEATRRIRELGTEYARSIPVIALTANAVEGNEAMFLANGFQAFVSKPIDIGRLDEAIRRFVRDGSREEEAPPEREGKTAGGGGGRTPFGGIAGLDASLALERFGNGETLGVILRSFATHTKPLLKSVETVDAGNLRTYATHIHGIKGSALNICAGHVGGLAAALEEAARKDDLHFVKANNPAFLEAAEKLIADIRAALDATEAEARPKPRRTRPDVENLLALCAACDSRNMGAIKDAMRKIEGYEYEDDGELVAWLRENLADMNYAPIVKKLSWLRMNTRW